MTTPRDLDAWEAKLKRERGWPRQRCYQALEISYDRYMRMREGKAPIPAHIGLAMQAIIRNLAPYGAG